MNVHKNSRLTWQWIPGICLSLSPQEEDSKAVPPCPPLLNMDSRIRFRSPCMLLYWRSPFPRPKKSSKGKNHKAGCKKRWKEKKSRHRSPKVKAKQARCKKKEKTLGWSALSKEEGRGRKTGPPGGGEPLTPSPGTFCLWWHYSYYIFLLLLFYRFPEWERLGSALCSSLWRTESTPVNVLHISVKGTEPSRNTVCEDGNFPKLKPALESLKQCQKQQHKEWSVTFGHNS